MTRTWTNVLDDSLALLRANGGHLEPVLRCRPDLPQEIREALETAALVYRLRLEPPPPSRLSRDRIVCHIARVDAPRSRPGLRQMLVTLSSPLTAIGHRALSTEGPPGAAVKIRD